MTEQISARDWERLSAYLDNDLEAGRRERLEQRLRAEPALRRAYAQLQRTRALLRQAPQARVPRSFALTPEMAGTRSIWARLSLSTLSAVASLALVIVLIGDFLTPGGISETFFASQQAAPVAESTEEELQALAAPAEGDRATEEQAEDAAEPAVPAADSATEDEGAEVAAQRAEDMDDGAALPWILVVEVVLALVAIISGVGAWLARRRM